MGEFPLHLPPSKSLFPSPILLFEGFFLFSSSFLRGETVGWRKYAKNRKEEEEEDPLVPFPRRRRCEIRQSLRLFLGDYGCLFLELAELIRDWIFGKFRSCFSSPSARRRRRKRRRKGLKKLSQTCEEKRKKKRKRGSVFGCYGRRWHSQERSKIPPKTVFTPKRESLLLNI